MKAKSGLSVGVGHSKLFKFVMRDKDGVVLWVDEFRNRVPTEGLNDALDKHLNGVAYTASWSIGLIDNAGFSALAAGDTAAQIGGSNGWAELTSYSQANRVPLVLGAASGGSIDNTASLAVFTINASVTIYGAFISSDSTKGGTSGVLYGEGALSTPQPAISGNSLSLTVVLTASSL